MDEAEFEQLSAEILDGRVPDWKALEQATPPNQQRRLDALRVIARIASASREQGDSKEPERWGGFDLIEPVGHGGYGEVWRAYDPQLDRYIALKLVPADDDDEAQDVLREGRLLARVRHPNIAAVYGASRINCEIGVAMEFVDGDDLDTRVRRDGRMSPHEVRNIGLQLARALEAVHRAGVLHRDVKASNVKCADDGRVILLDFGSSRELRAHSSDPASEAGTPLYLAPEVLRGGPASIQSDLYSLGVLLYYLATGRYPVRATSMDGLRSAHAQRATTRGWRADPNIPRSLARLLDSLLASDPLRRPRSAAQVAARLGRNWHRYTVAAAIATLAVGVAGAFAAKFHVRSSGFFSDAAGGARKLQFAIAPSGLGRASSDGRILPFVDRRTGGLAVLHLDSGEIELLMTDADVVARFVGMTVASPNGHRIAYQWHGDAIDEDQLKVFDLDAKEATVAWRMKKGTEIRPTAWSHDGAMIAGVLEHEDGKRDLFTIVPGGDPDVIEIGGGDMPTFSSDDRFLVFEKVDPTTNLNTLWTLEIPSGTPRRLPIGGSNDHSPIWTRRGLAFVSERDGLSAVWTVDMNATSGEAEGVPTRVSGTEGVAELLAATEDGTLICNRREGNSQVLVSNLDGSNVQEVSTGPGAHLSPDWSPDGTRIAYITQPPSGPVRHVLRIRDLQTGIEQSYENLGASFGTPGQIGFNPRFSPDGSRMILRRANGGFFVVNPNTGEESKQFAEGRQYGDVEWDDNTHVFFLDFNRGISRLNLVTNEEQRLFEVAPGTVMGRGITVTPDRSRIGFVVTDGASYERYMIMVMNRDGSDVHELLRKTKPSGRIPFFAAVPLLLGEWTSDGSAILFAATDVLPSGFTKWATDLWSMPDNNGPALRTGLTVRGLRDVRPQPHGDRIAFTSFTNHVDTWVLQGVLRHADVLR